MQQAAHLEVDFGSSCGHLQAQGWCINPTITLSKDEEIILGEIWELGEEALEGFVIIFSHLREEQHEMNYPSFSL